ncbi:MAG: hypothetical protein ACI9VR_003694 [Cognaticolwellia sp.]|jgi:hypothetical protein
MLPLLLSLLSAPVLAKETPASPQTISDAELAELEARALYQVALQLVIQGDYSQARMLFERVGAEYPNSAIAPEAEEQIALLGTLETKGRGLRDPAASARAELMITQTVVAGLFLGVALPGSTWQPSEPGPPVVLGLAGGAAGAVGSHFFAKEFQPSTGQVMSLFTGEVLGAANGFGLSAAFPPRDYRAAYQQALLGTLIGAGGGVAVAKYLDPDAGQVAAVNAGMLWGTYFSSMSFLLWEENNPRFVAMRVVGGADLGAGLGALSAHYFPVSRGRANVINLGGVAGTAVGGGIVLLANFYGGLYDQEPTAGILMASTGAGLATAALLTRNMGESERASAAVPGGVLVGVYGDQVGFGVPLPTVAVTQEGELGVALQLAAGRF